MSNGSESRPAMQDNEIERLVATAGAVGEPDQYTGKRAARRFAVGMRLDVATDPNVPACLWPVIMHNICDGGFAFWSRRQLRNGGEIWVREFTSDDSAPWISAWVTHCTVGIKGYLTGATFDRPGDVD